jgi:hypothetical protein
MSPKSALGLLITGVVLLIVLLLVLDHTGRVPGALGLLGLGCVVVGARGLANTRS